MINGKSYKTCLRISKVFMSEKKTYLKNFCTVSLKTIRKKTEVRLNLYNVYVSAAAETQPELNV